MSIGKTGRRRVINALAPTPPGGSQHETPNPCRPSAKSRLLGTIKELQHGQPSKAGEMTTLEAATLRTARPAASTSASARPLPKSWANRSATSPGRRSPLRRLSSSTRTAIPTTGCLPSWGSSWWKSATPIRFSPQWAGICNMPSMSTRWRFIISNPAGAHRARSSLKKWWPSPNRWIFRWWSTGRQAAAQRKNLRYNQRGATRRCQRGKDPHGPKSSALLWASIR